MVHLPVLPIARLNGYTSLFGHLPGQGAISYKLFGISEWSFRFTNAAFAFLSVPFLYFFARKWFNKKAALLSCLILISSLGFFSMARVVTTDMRFSFFLFASLLCFYDFYRNKKPIMLYLFYPLAGLATLAKGPVAVIFLYSLLQRRIK